MLRLISAANSGKVDLHGNRFEFLRADAQGAACPQETRRVVQPERLVTFRS